MLEWVAITTPGDLPDPGIEPASLTSLTLAGRFFTTNATWKSQQIINVKSLQLPFKIKIYLLRWL